MTAVINPVVLRSGPQGRFDDEPLYEIIDGEPVELPLRSILVSRVASKLHAHLGCHLLGNAVGEALMGMLFRLPLPGTAIGVRMWRLCRRKPSPRPQRNRARTMPGPSSPR
jgi:hypothetical protein